MGMLVNKLALILAEEFERESFCEVDPFWFRCVAEKVYAHDRETWLASLDEDLRLSFLSMEVILRRVNKRID